MLVPMTIAKNDADKIREAYLTSMRWVLSILTYARKDPPKKLRLAVEEAITYIEEVLHGNEKVE